ncbi:hypothetical protein ACUU9X_28520, partial [Bacillus cereus]|uniref:hypothetical protein n=1 Tax=Bacillus cereus TaxID=1396 RepID=UPI004055307D
MISSSQDEETSHFEEQGLNTNQGIMVGHKEDKTVDQDKSYATTSYEDSTESSIFEVDCSQLEQKEHLEKDGENTSSTEALAADFIESTLTMEEVQD